MEESTNHLTFEEEAVQKIVGKVIHEAPQILKLKDNWMNEMKDQLSSSTDLTKGVDVKIDNKEVEVNASAVVKFPTKIPDLFHQLEKDVINAVNKMTNLTVKKFNLNVVDVKSNAEIESEKSSSKNKNGNE